MNADAWDVVVIGAGAAGLLAAASAASRGRRTLLVEKNRKLGVKILISGGTRCNITHDANQAGIAAGFAKYQGKFLRSALAAFPPERILSLLHEQGVATKVEATGKVFPVSDRAIDVRDALVAFARLQRVVIEREVSVRAIDPVDGGFVIQSDSPLGQLHARRVIVACGGQSYPGCGTIGEGYGWARRLGHTIVQPVPALTPIKSSARWLHEHSGLTLPDAELLIVRNDALENHRISKAAVLERQRGSLLFTHFGISGPTALNASRAITRADDRRDLRLAVDLVPAATPEVLLAEWQAAGAADGKRAVSALLSERLPRKLAVTVMAQAEVPTDRRIAELSKLERQWLVRALKANLLEIDGTLGFTKAEVTAGGVALDEVHSKTLESRLVPGLHFVGEVLDIDGLIGGYNFQAAFSTGWSAGAAV
jgi:predicted Rossmann fold flavoprotein